LAGITSACNCLSLREDKSTGEIKVRWDLTPSLMPIIRPQRTINGALTIRPSGSGAFTFQYEGDQFPRQELYFWRDGLRTVLAKTGQSYDASGMAQAGTAIRGTWRKYWV
jgi:hypothetical protein